MENGLVTEMAAHMPTVNKYDTQLNRLLDSWDLIRSITEITCARQSKYITPNLISTQTSFKSLQDKLISQLVIESMNKLHLEMASKAQVAIDILIRNLFERTADVGFLATDEDLRMFLKNKRPSLSEKAFIKNRLHEYVIKYTVYDDIIVLDTAGVVKANLDMNNDIVDRQIDETLVKRTLETKEAYTQTFAHSALQSHKQNALIYSCKINESNDSHSKAIGVLCLCFKFKDEMAGIFSNLIDSDDKFVLSILDSEGHIVASSDEDHLANGKKMRIALGNALEVVNIRGRDYYAKTLKTRGYQGYEGMGWLGHIVIPCDGAFKTSIRANGTMDRVMLNSIISSSSIFSKELSEIASNAERLNVSLRRIVWNGQLMSRDLNKELMTSDETLHQLFNEISKLGTKTSNVFAQSIENLHETAFSTTLHDVAFLASLAIDIMDRNLYERANDCRWWAQTSEFRIILAKSEISKADQIKMTNILEYINMLYTVYTNIFVYDTDSKIIAVSNSQFENWVGYKLEASYCEENLRINDSQKYTVSSFDKTALYEGRYTYIYGAPITDIEDSNVILGGIGLVFDSEPQFDAMLQDALPSGEGDFGVYTTREKRVIASTEKKIEIGSMLDVDEIFFELPNGEGKSSIIVYEGAYYAVGCMTSKGYREYKNSDGYENDVLAFIFSFLGKAQEESVETVVDTSLIKPPKIGDMYKPEDSVGLATFFVGKDQLALYATDVKEAILIESREALVKFDTSSYFVEGTIKYKDTLLTIINLRALFNLNRNTTAEALTVIIIETQGGLIGLLVDTLFNVSRIGRNEISNVTINNMGGYKYVNGIVLYNDGLGKSNMITILDRDRITKL